jgi:hypothetical protein
MRVPVVAVLVSSLVLRACAVTLRESVLDGTGGSSDGDALKKLGPLYCLDSLKTCSYDEACATEYEGLLRNLAPKSVNATELMQCVRSHKSNLLQVTSLDRTGGSSDGDALKKLGPLYCSDSLKTCSQDLACASEYDGLLRNLAPQSVIATELMQCVRSHKTGFLQVTTLPTGCRSNPGQCILQMAETTCKSQMDACKADKACLANDHTNRFYQEYSACVNALAALVQ